jgi:hypothetical protein
LMSKIWQRKRIFYENKILLGMATLFLFKMKNLIGDFDLVPLFK